jgi:hypothetical protein
MSKILFGITGRGITSKEVLDKNIESEEVFKNNLKPECVRILE